MRSLDGATASRIPIDRGNAREVSNPSARRSCLAERISETIGHPDYADQDYTHNTME
jgi:hypothetical protein